MSHERFEELCALALYDEVTLAERAELDAHRTGCARCRELTRALAHGLGRVARSASAAPPAGWDAALRRTLDAERRALRPRIALWPVAASFAAGLLVTWIVLRGADEPRDGASDAKVAEVARSASDEARTPWSRFHTDRAPPRATSAGSLGRMLAARR